MRTTGYGQDDLFTAFDTTLSDKNSEHPPSSHGRLFDWYMDGRLRKTC